jgi:putative endonuclease
MTWIVYMLHCADGTFYTGITMNMEKRLEQHTQGVGAKYTKGRGPFTVSFTEVHPTKSSALKREIAIKRLSKAEKERLHS